MFTIENANGSTYIEIYFCANYHLAKPINLCYIGFTKINLEVQDND